MTSLMIHAALGLLCVVLFFYVNRNLYRSGWSGSRTSALEALYYLIAVGSVSVGWYFDVKLQERQVRWLKSAI